MATPELEIECKEVLKVGDNRNLRGLSRGKENTHDNKGRNRDGQEGQPSEADQAKTKALNFLRRKQMVGGYWGIL